MRRAMLMLAVPATLVVAACGRNTSKADDGLKSDLALASQAQPYNPNQVVSPTEQGLAAQPQALQTTRAPVRTQPVRRVSTTTRRSSGASRSSGSSGGYYPAPAPRTTVEKHTQRDAAIGAAAGAVIGATSSRNKVKGGIIGAAVGGILGGVIGNNVDKQTKTIPFE